MKIGDIDYNKEMPKKSLFLCKPNKSIIAKVKEAYDIQYYTKLSTINELSFKIPTIIIKDEIPMDNPNIERIRHRYIFKLVINGKTEYFLFNESNKVYSDEDYVEYKAYSLGVQLGDKNIRTFEATGNLQEITNKLLDSTYNEVSVVPIQRWRVGIVDAYFVTSSLAVRSYEVSSMSMLEVIYNLAEKWNAVIEWDTENLKINFYQPDNVGLNKGFYIRDGKYLEGFDLNVNTNETITRLKAFGQDGLTISEVNPLGQNYIQDFTYYVYPFERDSITGKVLQSSHYMTDELCIALENYQALLDSTKENYKNITAQINTAKGILANEENNLLKLKTEQTLIEDERDVLLSEFQNDKLLWGKNGFNEYGTKADTPAHTQILERLSVKRLEVSNQQKNVDNLKFKLSDIQSTLNDYFEMVSTQKNFTVLEWEELQSFIIEKEYTNDTIITAEKLLEEAMIVFKQHQEPAISLSVNLIDFLSILECQNDWDKLDLGDTIRIRYDRLKVDIKAKIIEINYNFEDSSISLTIANEKDLENGSKHLMDLLNKADITSTIVGMDRYKWDLAEENNGKINDIINSKWDALKQAVVAGYEQQISISERGIIVKSLDDPESWLVIQNGFLAITNDSGNSWKHAISKDGIWGEHIFGKIISGVNLYIEDESGLWKTQGSRTTIFDRNGTEVMRLGLVSDNQKDSLGNIIPQSEECFGLKSWNQSTMVELTDCEGLAISRWGNKYTDDGEYGWEKVFWADTNGSLYARDLTTQNIKIVNDIGETILDAENNFFNIGIFEKIISDGKLTNLEKLQIITELYQIYNDYKNVLAQADKYIRSSRDNKTDVNGAFNVSNQEFPTNKTSTDRFSVTPLKQAYLNLMNYISEYIEIINNGYYLTPQLVVDYNSPLTESTSEIEDRGEFIQKFRNYYDESQKLSQAIEDSIFYSGIHMGEYYNNLVMNEFGFIAVRDDGKYRAYLNATNGLALEKWENNHWVKKLYASIGNDEYEDGTLIAEELVAKKLRIETKFNEVLLDMDSLNFDFTTLTSITYDDIIISPEKSTLSAMFDSITSQYNMIITQLDKYIDEVYNDRDSSINTSEIYSEYYDIDSAHLALQVAKTNLTDSYNALKETLDIVFSDMNITTVISTDLGMTKLQFDELFKNFSATFEIARSSLENFLEKSSLQLGRNYNNTIIDAEHGVTVFRGNMTHKVQMNATEGFSLSRNDGTFDVPVWTDLFYVDTDGGLYAQDITTHNLKIVDGNLGEKIIFDENDGITINGNNGEVISLNGNDGIRIKVNEDDKFWIGTDGRLYAKDITTHNLRIVDGNLGEKILFNENDGITINGNNGEQIRLNANEGIAIDVNGDERFWVGTDGLLYAKKLIVMNEFDDAIIDKVTGSYISDLTVNKVKTLNNNNPTRYVHIEDDYIKVKAPSYTVGGEEQSQWSLDFRLKDGVTAPVIQWGAGSNNAIGKNIGYQWKSSVGFFMQYVDSDGYERNFGMHRDNSRSIFMQSPHDIIVNSDTKITLKIDDNNYIAITKAGVTIKGDVINLN